MRELYSYQVFELSNLATAIIHISTQLELIKYSNYKRVITETEITIWTNKSDNKEIQPLIFESTSLEFIENFVHVHLAGADPEKILTRSTSMASEASQKNIGGSGGAPPEKILKPHPLDWLRTYFRKIFFDHALMSRTHGMEAPLSVTKLYSNKVDCTSLKRTKTCLLRFKIWHLSNDELMAMIIYYNWQLMTLIIFLDF